MRKSAKALGLVVVSFLAAIVLAVGSAFTAAVSFGAVGLFVPGTGTPNANGVADYLSNARDRYTFNTPCSSEANCPTALENPLSPSLQGINYPASFFPLVIIPNWCRSGPNGCDKWDDSVGQGTAALNKALAPYLDVNNKEGVTIFGYSQGGAVVSNVLNGLGGVDQSVKDRLKVVTIGGIENPDGGLWSRLGFLPTIPFLDITFGPPMPTNTGIDTTAIGFEYDPVTYAPRYFGNALAVLNAFAALETVHGYYLAPNGNGPDETLPYGYTPATLADQLNCSKNPGNCRSGQTVGTKNTYIMIPATTLPIFDLVMGAVPAPLKPFVQPVVNLLTPVTKLLIDLGYDWSGDPDKPTPLSILPFNPLTFNPVDFAVKFVGAIAQGIQDAIRGGPVAVAPAATPAPISALAKRSIAPTDATATMPEPSGELASVTPLADAKKSAPTPDVTTGAAADTDIGSTTPIASKGKESEISDAPAKAESTTTPAVKSDLPSTTVPTKTEPAKDEPTPNVSKDQPAKSPEPKGDSTTVQSKKADPDKDRTTVDGSKKAGPKKAEPAKAGSTNDAAKSDAKDAPSKNAA